LRIAIVSTYPPRACGIGTFSRDLRAALIEADPSTEVEVMAIVREDHAPAAEVVSVIRQEVRADYLAAAELLDDRETDVVLIEHEYGIFGGQVGRFVLSLVRELQRPFVLTLHTVLSEPSAGQEEVLRELCERATLVTVFTQTARRMVLGAGMTTADRVRVLPHGAPTALLPSMTPTALLAPMEATDGHARRPGPGVAGTTVAHLQGRTVLSTFGLISAGKGIETAIQAIAKIAPLHPDVLYLIAGQTHPEVVKFEGERYRLGLQRLVRDLGLQRNVQFLDQFLSTEELAVLLSSTDLYLTPYRSREQIVSGALTFAIVAGCPVVSTPYFYAEDLLGSGAGVLVPFDDPEAFADGILQLLDDPEALAAAGREARRIGAELAWPAVGAQTLGILGEALQLSMPSAVAGGAPHHVASAPPIQPQHLLTLIDDVGIMQHADGVVPNRSSGYCVDDIARLVIVATALDRGAHDSRFSRILTLGLSFLRHAWDPAAPGMHNFMSYQRQWLDQPHTGDHLGRTVWALGVVIAAHPPRAVVAPSMRLLQEIAPVVQQMDSLRAVAFTVLGLAESPLEAWPPTLQQSMQMLAARLLTAYTSTSSDNWRWFEDELTYDNARLSQALIGAGHRLGNPEMLHAGLESLNWYRSQCLPTDAVVHLIGNKWRRRSEPPAEPLERGDEQPVDAAALVEALAQAFAVTGQPEYGAQAVRVFEWFLGRNHRNEPIYDFATGGCHDGLGSNGVSENEGAESTLAYYQALLALEEAGLLSSLPLRGASTHGADRHEHSTD
jgi:glycosyltransferase involved in cell wall biosynthesis